MTTYISVDRRVIKRNLTPGRNDPPVSVREGRDGPARYGHRVSILGPSEVVYDPAHPLKCGSRLWIETSSEVTVE